jgi:hypothetical protein
MTMMALKAVSNSRAIGFTSFALPNWRYPPSVTYEHRKPEDDLLGLTNVEIYRPAYERLAKLSFLRSIPNIITIFRRRSSRYPYIHLEAVFVI